MDFSREQLAERLEHSRHNIATQVLAVDAEDDAAGPEALARREAVADHVAHLAQAVALDEPNLLCEHERWLSSYRAARGLASEPWQADVRRIEAVLASWLEAEAFGLVRPYLAVGVTLAGAAEPTALTELGRRYLDALLRGRRDAAAALVHRAIAEGAELATVYLDVFQGTQREIGRLWEVNRLSVAEEHYCTAATQGIMAELYPQLFSRPRREGRTFVAACTGQELHELGVRMVADFFEMAGWRTHYLGANPSHEQLEEALRHHRPEVVGLSASMSYHVRGVAQTIARLRTNKAFDRVKVLVGGHPFNLATQLWRKVGADGHADDARSAVAVAEALLQADTPGPGAGAGAGVEVAA